MFSNTVAPAIVGGSLKALEIVTRSTELRDTLMRNTQLFRQEIAARGFDILPGEHPIVPIMLGDAALATRMADRLLELGVYVIGFSYPVVPKVRRASACKFPPPTRKRTFALPPSNSARPATMRPASVF